MTIQDIRGVCDKCGNVIYITKTLHESVTEIKIDVSRKCSKCGK